jgi:hypothetical protein
MNGADASSIKHARRDHTRIMIGLTLELMDPTIMTFVTTIDRTIVVVHGTEPLGDHRRTEDTKDTRARPPPLPL